MEVIFIFVFPVEELESSVLADYFLSTQVQINIWLKKVINPLSVNSEYTLAWENFPKSGNDELTCKNNFQR